MLIIVIITASSPLSNLRNPDFQRRCTKHVLLFIIIYIDQLGKTQKAEPVGGVYLKPREPRSKENLEANNVVEQIMYSKKPTPMLDWNHSSPVSQPGITLGGQAWYTYTYNVPIIQGTKYNINKCTNIKKNKYNQ